MVSYETIPANMPSWHSLRARADRVRWMVYARAEKASIEAGLGKIGCQLHNALVGLELGKPWRGVSYSKARLANRLLDQQFAARQILDRLYDRYGPDLIMRDQG